MSLDIPTSEFQYWIEQTGKLITDFYKTKEEGAVFAGKSPREVRLTLPIYFGKIYDIIS